MYLSEIKEKVTKCCLASNYLPAVLREHKSGWLVEYYVENPATKKLVRKIIKINRLVSRYKYVKDARLHANKIVVNLNIKLSTGWNPLFTSEDARLYTSIEDVCKKFLTEKRKDLSPPLQTIFPL